MTDRNLYGKYFKLSGFTEKEVHDIACHTKKAKQATEEQKARRRAEKQIMKFRRHNGFNSGVTLEAIIKAQRNMTRGRKKNKMQKTTEQIQYGYAIAAWMGLQHG